MSYYYEGIDFDDDLYITSQSSCMAMFGNYESSYNGCSWIALYNFFRSALLDEKEKYSDCIIIPYALSFQREAAAKLKFGGAFGLLPYGLKKVYTNFSLPRMANVFKDMCGELAYDSSIKSYTKRGIIFFFNGRMFHWTAYTYDGEYTFYNLNNRREKYNTIQDFIDKNVRGFLHIYYHLFRYKDLYFPLKDSR